MAAAVRLLQSSLLTRKGQDERGPWLGFLGKAGGCTASPQSCRACGGSRPAASWESSSLATGPSRTAAPAASAFQVWPRVGGGRSRFVKSAGRSQLPLAKSRLDRAGARLPGTGQSSRLGVGLQEHPVRLIHAGNKKRNHVAVLDREGQKAPVLVTVYPKDAGASKGICGPCLLRAEPSA